LNLNLRAQGRGLYSFFQGHGAPHEFLIFLVHVTCPAHLTVGVIALRCLARGSVLERWW